MSSYSFTSGTSRVTLVIKLTISIEWGKDREVFMTSGTYRGYVSIKSYISGYLMAHQGKQKQSNIPTPSSVGQAQATVSNIYIFTL